MYAIAKLMKSVKNVNAFVNYYSPIWSLCLSRYGGLKKLVKCLIGQPLNIKTAAGRPILKLGLPNFIELLFLITKNITFSNLSRKTVDNGNRFWRLQR